MTYDRLSDFSVDGVVQSSVQGLFIGTVDVMPDASAATGLTLLYTGSESGYDAGTFYVSDGSAWSVALVSQSILDSLDAKQDVITGAASTVTADDLTAERAVVSDSDGKISASSVTSTEVGYLSGVTSAIQTQIDSLLAAIGNITSFEISVVDTLPETGEAGTIYFAPSSNSQSDNVYNEFLYVNGGWEQVGSTTFTLDVTQTSAGISVNGTALQTATTTQTGLMSSTHASTLGDLETRMTSAESGIATNAAGISANADGITDLASDVADLATDVATNTANIATNASDIADLASTVAANTAGIEANAKSIAANADDITGLTLTVATNSSNISKNISSISTNTANIATNASDISSLDDRVTALEDAEAVSVAAGDGITVSTEGTVSTVSLSEIHSGLSGGSASKVPTVTVDAYGRTTALTVSTIYAPTTVGEDGQVWTSDGSTGGTWADSGVSALESRVTSAESSISANATNISTNTEEISVLRTDLDALNDTVVAAVSGSISILVVDTLPTTGVDNTIYFVPNGGSDGNIHDEYMYVDDTWELIGTTEFELTIDQTASGISINDTSLQTATSSRTGLMTADAYTQLTGAVSDLSTLSDAVSENATSIATNAADIATNKSSIQTLSTDLSSLESTVATNTADIATNASDISTLTSTVSGKQDGMTSTSVTLAVNSWLSGSQTIVVSGMTSTATVWVSPAPDSYDDYCAAGIRATAQASNSLTFEYSTAPSTVLTVNVVFTEVS